MVAGEEGGLCESDLVVDGEGCGVCGEEGACCGAEDGDEGEDSEDCVAFPEGPVLDVLVYGRKYIEEGEFTNGSLGSSLGWGTRMMGTGPVWSYLRFGFGASCSAVLESSSRMKEVPTLVSG